MSSRGSLHGLTVTMKKAPHHLKVEAPLQPLVNSAESVDGEVVVFSGSVRDLCPLAPNNVNTMAAAAVAAERLGFDGVKAVLIADRRCDIGGIGCGLLVIVNVFGTLYIAHYPCHFLIAHH